MAELPPPANLTGTHVETFNVGDVIDGQYTITAILGKGGMGLVLAAQPAALNTPVAIKVLLPELRDKPEVAARFSREARAADTLRSEHVARVRYVGVTAEGTPYIVMEYLAGKDLAAIITERRRLDVAQAADYLLQACEAIGEAHSHGIVHRDLKPANIFVTTSVDGLPFVKVLDFGIAKANFPNDVVSTDTSAFFGSPLYMSPEQLARPRDVDARADVWALGIILYEMVAGETPFTGETVPVVCGAILAGKYTKLSSLRPDIPADLEALVVEALALKAELRVPSVEAFARRLAPFGTSSARQSYERIERLAAAATHPELSRPPPRSAPLAETADGVRQSVARTTGPLVKSEPPVVPAAKPRARGATLLAGAVAIAAVAGGVFGVRHRDSAAPAPASSTTPAADVAGSASAVASAPSPSAAASSSAASATPTSSVAVTSVPSMPTAAVIAASAPASSAPAAKTDECAKGATAACESACAAHAPGRCEALAKALVKGTGAPKDIPRAQKLYDAECDGGAGSACNALGVLYAVGTDVPKDNATAVRYYKRGCDDKDLRSCVNLGGMHFSGTGVPKNEALGVTFFTRGCPSSGPVEPGGCLNLSIAYSQGRGVPKDPSLALSFAKQACDKGAPAGCARVSMAKLTGDGISKDVPGGIAELDGLCGKGETTACADLISLYAKGLGSDVPADKARVRAVAEKGCKAHDAQSCHVQTLLETEDSTDTSVALSFGQLEASCNAGVLRDCGFLGERVLVGQGVPVDRAKGLALLDRACKGGVARACQKFAEAGGR